ncbi:Fc.00g014820.m01.CDS01 [Cosmosporella sp. VM-42]
MLAVQQAPRMGSSQPPSDPFLPFGYAVDPNQEPLLEPPEPAPGAPLLSENDSRLLSSFFEDMTADHYNMPSFGEGLNFSDTWLDLPPQFMGTTTSFGQQPGPSMAPPIANGLSHHPADFHGMHLGPNSMPPPPPPPQPQPHMEHRRASEDVLNAAATLLHNGSSQRHNSNGSDGSFARRPVGPPVGHLRHQPLEEFKEEGRRGIATDDHDNTFTEWMFGPQERRNPRNAPPTDVQWGSDSSFSHLQAFTPTSDKETSEAMSKQQLKYLDCFEPSQSRDNTRPSSPNHNQMAPPASSNLADPAKRQQEPDAPPRKRRKSKSNKEALDDDAAGDTNVSKTARRKKGKSERAGSASSPPHEDGKRRKSAVNGSKASRENLSEEQKRENHIRSEQKRRTLIKEGFDDLCDLVPGLRGGGFSKSTMLTMAAEWLEDLLKGNEVLNNQLAGLERG